MTDFIQRIRSDRSGAVEDESVIPELGPKPEAWREPDPLPDPLLAVNPYRSDLMPGCVGQMIDDIAERMQCPPDYPAASMLVAMSAVVGCTVGIRPKRRDDWLVVPNLWGCVVGRPSLKKTPAVAGAKAMLDRLEAVAREDMQPELEQAANDMVTRPVEVEALKAQLKKAIQIGDADEKQRIAAEIRELVEQDPPEPRRISTNDPTLPKLGELLRRHPQGMLLFRDELLSWLKTLDREDHAGDREGYLELWTGFGRYTVDRIGRGTVVIESPCLSVFGCVTPGPFSSYLSAAISGGSGDDGLLQRLQVTVWPDAPKEYKHVDRWPDNHIKAEVTEVFLRLLRLDPEVVGANCEGDGEIPYLRFNGEGQEVFDHWLQSLESELRDSDLPEAYESHLSKYRSLMPSIALLLHFADGDDGPVSRRAAEMAVAWCDYLKSHARRIYSAAISAERATAPVLLSRLVKWPADTPITARAVGRKGWSGLTDAAAIKEAFKVLEDAGWCRSVESEPGKPGRKTTVYELHPQAAKYLQTPQAHADKTDETLPSEGVSSVSSVPNPGVCTKNGDPESVVYGSEVEI